MKKVIAVLIVLLILGTGVPSYFLVKTDNELSATRIEKMLVTQTLAATETTLVETEQDLTATNEKLTATEASRVATSEKLAATESNLAATLTEAVQLRGWISATQAELSVTQKEKEKIGAQLADIAPTLTLSAPEFKGTWDFSSTYPVLKEKFPDAQIFIRTSVKLVSRSDWAKFLRTDRVSEITYSLEDFNCTEYAEILQGRAKTWAPAGAFGIAAVGRTGVDQPGYYHLLNFFIDEEGKIWLVEPQNDSIFAPPINWQYLYILM